MNAIEALLNALAGPSGVDQIVDKLRQSEREREDRADQRRKLQRDRLWGDTIGGLDTGAALGASGKIDFLTEQRLAQKASSRRRNALRAAGVNPDEAERTRVSATNRSEDEYTSAVRNSAANRDSANRQRLAHNRDNRPAAYGGGFTGGMTGDGYRGVVTTPGKGSRTFQAGDRDAVRQQIEQALAAETDPTKRLALEIALSNLD